MRNPFQLPLMYWRTSLVALVGLVCIGLGTAGMGRLFANQPAPGTDGPNTITWDTVAPSPKPWLTLSMECPEGTPHDIMAALPPNTVCIIHLRSPNRLMVDHPTTYFRSGGSEVTIRFATEEH